MVFVPISLDARHFLANEQAIFYFPVSAFASFGMLTDQIYFKLDGGVPAYTYGYSWVLADKKSKITIKSARMIAGVPPGKSFVDSRSLNEVGIKNGTTLLVCKPS